MVRLNALVNHIAFAFAFVQCNRTFRNLINKYTNHLHFKASVTGPIERRIQLRLETDSKENKLAK